MNQRQIEHLCYTEVDKIQVGRRHRKDMGDMEALARSIDKIGLLQPIGITVDNELVFGERRLRAVRDVLRWKTIPARIVNVKSIVQDEYAENEVRKDFTARERYAIADAVKNAIGGRQGQRTDLEHRAGLPEVKKGKRPRDEAAERSGFSSTTVFRQVGAVIETGDEDLGQLMDDETISITAAAEVAKMPAPKRKKVVRLVKSGEAASVKDAQRALQKEERQAREKNKLAVELPAGKYRCIVIDPPWPMEKILRDVCPQQDVFEYPTMELEEIAKLPIADLAQQDGCHVYMWTTQRFLPDSFDLFKAWGVRYECLMTWVKNVGFTPYSWMYTTEHVLFGRVGKLDVQRIGMRLDFEAKRREHSRKPDVFFERVLEASPGPRLEMFSREPREGFKQHGNQTGKFCEQIVFGGAG